MMKHAYLILAHGEFQVLGRLLRALDDKRNDIYIHFDGKLKNYPGYRTSHAGLYVLTERIKVYWGDYSMIKAEYALFEEADKHGGYSYYHLLSGVDMPLKSQDYIHRFFARHAGKEFIGFHQKDIAAQIERKVRLWHVFPHTFRETSGVLIKGKQFLRAGILRLQLYCGLQRNKSIDFKKGTQWISVTGDFIACLLQHKEEVLHTYRHTFCADEIFAHTICWHSEYRERVYDIHAEQRGCMRMIGWKDNRIYEWTETDLKALIDSDALFARKFSGKHLDVVDALLERTSESYNE